MRQRRSREMQLVAYALARCAAPDPSGKPDRPPVWLAASSWKDAYAAFFDALGDGRTPEAFRNSLKHARDAFDAQIASGRIGWVDKKAGGKPFRKDAMVSETLATWAHRTDDELRDEVLGLLDGGATEVPEEHSARTEGGQRSTSQGGTNATRACAAPRLPTTAGAAWAAGLTSIPRTARHTAAGTSRSTTASRWPTRGSGRLIPSRTSSCCAPTATACCIAAATTVCLSTN